MLISWKDERPGIITRIGGSFDRGLPVVLPTDTLYGLAAPLENVRALKMIMKIKRRPHAQTLPVVVGSVDSIKDVAVISRNQREMIQGALPGPVTFILKAKKGLPELVTRQNTVAVRVVDHPIFEPLCTAYGPLALTSVNVHGSPPLLRSDDIEAFLGDTDIIIVSDDDHVSDRPSSVIDLTEGLPTVLRKGKINIEELLGESDG